jgi:hypothetical protein
MYNWYHSFTTAVIQHIYGHKLQYTLYIALPLCSPFLLTWHPPAVTGMVHLSPRLLVNCPLCPPLLPRTPPFPILHPHWVFPGPNVLLIRTHPNPFPSVRHSNKLIAHLRFSWRFLSTVKFATSHIKIEQRSSLTRLTFESVNFSKSWER